MVASNENISISIPYSWFEMVPNKISGLFHNNVSQQLHWLRLIQYGDDSLQVSF